jgi:hypothetical protein
MVAFATAVLAAVAAGADEAQWEIAATGPITVKTKASATSRVKEIWAEGEIAAPVQDIQSTVMDPESFPKFMPYVVEASKIGSPEVDGGQVVYTRLELPLVASRDYVLKVYLERSVAPDGGGEFRNRWIAVPDRLPERARTVRLKINDGSWHVTSRGDGRKSWAVYRFAVDPGGWIPAFVANLGNKSGVLETFEAVEREAQRRASGRDKHFRSPP